MKSTIFCLMPAFPKGIYAAISLLYLQLTERQQHRHQDVALRQTINVVVDVANVILQRGNGGVHTHQLCLEERDNICGSPASTFKITCNTLVGGGEIVVGTATGSRSLEQEDRVLTVIRLHVKNISLANHLNGAVFVEITRENETGVSSISL